MSLLDKEVSAINRKPEDSWYNDVGGYMGWECLSHTFNNQKSYFIISDNLIKFCPHEESLRDHISPGGIGDDAKAYLNTKDKTLVKNIVSDIINNFDGKKDITPEDVQNSIVFQINNKNKEQSIETAKKTGHVQGVCECVAILGDNHDLAKKLMTETGVTKDIAKKYANPETYKALEQGIFAPKQEQHLEQIQGVKR